MSVEVVEIVALVMIRPIGMRESVGANGDDGVNGADGADGADVVSAEDGQSRGRKSSCWSIVKAVLALCTASICERDM